MATEHNGRQLLAKGDVARICIDFALTLCFASEDGKSFEVRIEGDGTYTSHDGRSYEFSSESDPSTLAPLLHLSRGTINSIAVGPNGDLSIRFVGGDNILVPPLAEYESWQVSDSSGFLLVCLPGGELGEWSRRVAE